jgi:hypothetical protein
MNPLSRSQQDLVRPSVAAQDGRPIRKPELVERKPVKEPPHARFDALPLNTRRGASDEAVIVLGGSNVSMWSGAPVDVADTTGPNIPTDITIYDLDNGNYTFSCTVPTDPGSNNPTHFELKYIAGATALNNTNWAVSGTSPKGWEWNSNHPGDTYSLLDINHVWGTNLDGTYRVCIRYKDQSENLGTIGSVLQAFASASAGY